MRLAGSISADGEWHATPSVFIDYDVAERGSEGAGEGLVGCGVYRDNVTCIRPVMGENVYVEFLSCRPSGELSFYGRSEKQQETHTSRPPTSSPTRFVR